MIDPSPASMDAARPFAAQLGSIRLTVLSDGLFRLDGGSMFGVVPRIIWERSAPPDSKNRIDLGLNCLLIQTADRNILVDTGMGDKWPEKFVSIYDLRPPRGRLLDALSACGLAPEDIDTVVHTHLHLDHTGASTRLDAEGKLVPTFPNARYLVQEGEWKAAANPDLRSKPSYNPDHYVPLMEAGRIDFLDGESEVAPGVRTVLTPGHTAHHQSVLVESEGKKAFYFGDIVPTTAHLPPNYVMGFDLYPLEVMRQRTALVERALAEDWLCVWEHDPRVAAGRLAREDGKTRVVPAALAMSR